MRHRVAPRTNKPQTGARRTAMPWLMGTAAPYLRLDLRLWVGKGGRAERGENGWRKSTWTLALDSRTGDSICCRPRECPGSWPSTVSNACPGHPPCPVRADAGLADGRSGRDQFEPTARATAHEGGAVLMHNWGTSPPSLLKTMVNNVDARCIRDAQPG